MYYLLMIEICIRDTTPAIGLQLSEMSNIKMQ